MLCKCGLKTCLHLCQLESFLHVERLGHSTGEPTTKIPDRLNLNLQQCMETTENCPNSRQEMETFATAKFRKLQVTNVPFELACTSKCP